MNEKILQFPKKESEIEISEGGDLLALSEKLMPQGPSEKVKKHLIILGNMIEEIHNNGFEISIDEDDDTIYDHGTKGRINIRLTSSDWPQVNVSLIEDVFDNIDPNYTDPYPTEESIRNAYLSARQKAYARIGKQTIDLMKEGKIAFVEDKNNDQLHEMVHATAA